MSKRSKMSVNVRTIEYQGRYNSIVLNNGLKVFESGFYPDKSISRKLALGIINNNARIALVKNWS
jgi:hypothetical protein